MPRYRAMFVRHAIHATFFFDGRKPPDYARLRRCEREPELEGSWLQAPIAASATQGPLTATAWSAAAG